jgi:cytoskeletal protein RodZ
MILRKLKESGALSSDMSNFGASFKKARELKGISLDRIAAETRISTRFLLAIENEEFNQLPGGIFNRGFVRAYAEKVGLDPDQSVAVYERLVQVHEPPETSVAAAHRKKGDRHLYPLAVGGLIFLILIFYLVTRETSNTTQTASVPHATSASTVGQPAQPAQPASPPPPPPAESVAPPTTPPAVTSAAPEPAASPAAPTEALSVDLQVTETTWFKLDADGTTVDRGILEPGNTRHFTARNSILLTIGNAAGVALKINDMPAKSLGKSGQVRELSITPQNIKTYL